MIFIALILFAGSINIGNTMSIQCAFELVDFSTAGPTYSCNTILVTGGYSDNVTSVSGSHQNGKSHIDVLGLHMPSQNLQYFPRNVDEFFPNLIVLNLVNNNINSVSHDHLAPFPKLQYL